MAFIPFFLLFLGIWVLTGRIQNAKEWCSNFTVHWKSVHHQGWIFLRIPRFFNGEKFASFRWSREEFPICHQIILIDSGENALKVVRLKLVSHTNLPWSTSHGSLFYIFKFSGNNNCLKKVSQIALKNGVKFTLILWNIHPWF